MVIHCPPPGKKSHTYFVGPPSALSTFAVFLTSFCNGTTFISFHRVALIICKDLIVDDEKVTTLSQVFSRGLDCVAANPCMEKDVLHVVCQELQNEVSCHFCLGVSKGDNFLPVDLFLRFCWLFSLKKSHFVSLFIRDNTCKRYVSVMFYYL